MRRLSLAVSLLLATATSSELAVAKPNKASAESSTTKGQTVSHAGPKVHSEAGIAIDAETGAVLWSKRPDEVRAIASTTKIFVAMVVRKKGIDLKGWTEIVKSDARAARGGARTRLDVGKEFTNKDLLRAMLMASDNRAPTALGRAAGLTPDEMIEEMNKHAKKLGLKRTKFTDTSGLRGNVSTPREMALALRVALEDDVLREIMGDETEEVKAKGGDYSVDYTNTNVPLITKRFNVIGGKTGFTTAAGYCLVSAAKIGSRNVIFSFYGAPDKDDRFVDFNRVAGWIEDGSPGGEIALPKQKHGDAKPKRSAKLKASGRVNKS